jgi:hypothetical protein
MELILWYTNTSGEGGGLLRRVCGCELQVGRFIYFFFSTISYLFFNRRDGQKLQTPKQNYTASQRERGHKKKKSYHAVSLPREKTINRTSGSCLR